MKSKLFTAIGLMSGTSMDGVDISIISSDGYDQLINILDDYYVYDEKLQNQLFNTRNLISSKEDLTKHYEKLRELERNLTLFHADILKKIFQKYKDPIDIIGFHGQTIFHNANKKISKQLGDGKLLSQIIRKRVIYDFRQADIKNNGQGAPLAPIFHYVLSKIIHQKYKIKYPMGFLNIGGIANVTKILNTKDDINNNLFALDIGPGNCLIDNWVRNNSNKKYDDNGGVGKLGKNNELIFNQAIENFQIKKYSNSLDIKDFDISFARGLSFEDGCATITNFSAYLIAQGLEYISENNSINFFVCGGGRKNSYLIECINNYLSNKNKIVLDNVDNYNLKGDYIESQAFAYLAVRSFLNLPISFSNTTGCDKPSLGGLLAENF
tara:strand:+ start:288 stop:1430 length:1143 start_codon:yes stop_codon:yes gene_type:complete